MIYIPRRTGVQAVDRELETIASTLRASRSGSGNTRSPVVVIPLYLSSFTWTLAATPTAHDATYGLLYDFSRVQAIRLVAWVTTAPGGNGAYIVLKGLAPRTGTATELTSHLLVGTSGEPIYTAWEGIVYGQDLEIQLHGLRGTDPSYDVTLRYVVAEVM